MDDSAASLIMDEQSFQETLQKLASEIDEKTRGFEGTLALVGIRTRGVPLSRRLSEILAARTGRRPVLGILDITLYRDDLNAQMPVVRRTELPFSVDEAWIILVDDVLFTGRTVRAAITALVDFGRPRKIELLVMVDRGLRELPIQADYAGAILATTPEQNVKVSIAEEDGQDRVLLVEGVA